MHRNSLLHDVVVCATAAGPLGAIASDSDSWSAWIDFVTSNWIRYYADACAIRLILPCAFVCLALGARAQATLVALRAGTPR